MIVGRKILSFYFSINVIFFPLSFAVLDLCSTISFCLKNYETPCIYFFFIIKNDINFLYLDYFREKSQISYDFGPQLVKD